MFERPGHRDQGISDLLGGGVDCVKGNERLGIEVKLSSAPTITPSMRHALRDLKLDELIVVHAGDSTYPLAGKIRAVSAHRLITDL